MIRLIQRRLIIPRGDTGTFQIPMLPGKNAGDVSIFTIFDPLVHRKILEKPMTLADEVLTLEFTHGDTVNLPVGQFVWDIKFYTNPQFVDEKLVSGTEIDSYYAAFGLPVCEIRETGDNLLMSDTLPQATLTAGSIDLITAAINEITSAKEIAVQSKDSAVESATSAETSATGAQTAASNALEYKNAAVNAAADALASAQQAAATAAAIQKEIPTKVSDLLDDSGHYTKPATGIPAADLEETYLTQHQDISMKANSADLAAVATSGNYNDLLNKPTIPTAVSDLTDDSGHYTKPASGIPASDLANGVLDVWSGLTYHTSTMSTDSDSFVLGGATDAPTEINKCLVTSTPDANVIPKFDYQGRLHSVTPEDEWDGSNAVATTEYVDNMISNNMPEVPTNVSELTNDAGYLTEHQDISGKADLPLIIHITKDGDTIVCDTQISDILQAISNKEVLCYTDRMSSFSPVGSNVFLFTFSSYDKVEDTVRGAQFINEFLTTINNRNYFVKSTISIGSNGITWHDSFNLLPVNISELTNDSGYLTSYTETDPTVPSWAKAAQKPIYTAAEVGAPTIQEMNTAIGTAIGNINSFDMAVVQALPTQDISTHTIYLVPKTGETNDVYDEYVYINNNWEMVGNTQIDLSNYATKSNTILDNTLSRGRKEGTVVGTASVAFGQNSEASGTYSVAIGNGTTALEIGSYAQGFNTIASGKYARAEGYATEAQAIYSHAQGYNTIAAGGEQFVFGKYNVADDLHEWVANTEYKIDDKVKRTTVSNETTTVKLYICKENNNDEIFTSSKWQRINEMNYIEIVGNGSSTIRSNARALDWEGNEYLAGNIYVGANADSTGGTRLATITEVAAKLDAAEAGLKVVRLI